MDLTKSTHCEALLAPAEDTKARLRDYRTKGDTVARDHLLNNYVPLVKRVCSRFRWSQEP